MSWLYYRFIYRHLMRLAHRFNWHHMAVSYPENDKTLWCHWCGARYVIKGLPYKHNMISTAAQCEAKQHKCAFMEQPGYTPSVPPSTSSADKGKA